MLKFAPLMKQAEKCTTVADAITLKVTGPRLAVFKKLTLPLTH